jgi:hypothetical protein
MARAPEHSLRRARRDKIFVFFHVIAAQKAFAISPPFLYSLFVQETKQPVALSADAAAANAPRPAVRPNPALTKISSPADKIRLFRSLFRGREDVYPRRFENHIPSHFTGL